MQTILIKIDPQKIDLLKIKRAAEIIDQGGIVAVPTETVYGLAADFFNPQAVQRIFQVKKRALNKPLSVLITDIRYLEELADDIPALAYQLMSRFWPGPLTLVFPARHAKPVAGGKAKKATIGVRIPDHPIAQNLARACARPLVLPSANLSGKPAAKTAAEVLAVFDGQIEMVLDGGPVKLGIASTVVDLSVAPYKILRPGAISRREIQNAQA